MLKFASFFVVVLISVMYTCSIQMSVHVVAALTRLEVCLISSQDPSDNEAVRTIDCGYDGGR